jgi:hypothetical protein
MAMALSYRSAYRRISTYRRAVRWGGQIASAVLDRLVDPALLDEHGPVVVDQVRSFRQIQVRFDAALAFENGEAGSDEVLGVPRRVAFPEVGMGDITIHRSLDRFEVPAPL